MWGFVALTLASVAGLLVAERRGSRAGVWIAKPLASTGFIAAALAAGAGHSSYGRGVLVALGLCWLGDVLLIPRGAAWTFLAGLVSFLLGHVVYVVAFLMRGGGGVLPLGALVVLLLPAGLATRWLRPRLPGPMRVPVYAYLVVITLMVAAAAGATGRTGDRGYLAGAVMFYVSDLAVARERFVTSTFLNPLWGLPLYYGAQLVLAATVR